MYVLIVGAKSDIAKALAHQYAKAGYDLYLSARIVESLDNFIQDLQIRYECDVQGVELDVVDYESHEKVYTALQEQPVGVIIAVGYLGNQEEAQNSFKEAEKIALTNYVGVSNFLEVVAHYFEHRKSGFIVAISSVAGDRGRKSNYFYGAAKAALSTYLSGLRNRLVSKNISVLTVKPGFVETKMTTGMDLPERLTAQPEDVARAIFKAQQKGKKYFIHQENMVLDDADH